MPARQKAKPNPRPKSSRASASNQDLQAAFAGLRAILAKHSSKLKVAKDLPDNYYVDTHIVRKDGHPIFFGAVIIKKNYVSFHLMPIYTCPDIAKSMSPELKKRMQGKACFNFTAPDPPLFAELDALATNSIPKFHKFLETWKR